MMRRTTNYIPIDRNAIVISGFVGNKNPKMNFLSWKILMAGKTFSSAFIGETADLSVRSRENFFELCRYTEAASLSLFQPLALFAGDGKHLMMSNRRSLPPHLEGKLAK